MEVESDWSSEIRCLLEIHLLRANSSRQGGRMHRPQNNVEPSILIPGLSVFSSVRQKKFATWNRMNRIKPSVRHASPNLVDSMY